ncbi:ankyrin [Colletotrichum zoysiae]|uniref:Ankyrin n=1 Tax=Colletotrichum zoysiae TaxID=1216348 RepID=A0AAD9HKA1_9PEZI|nr:ankyrin [Colletotrichum zoysiae]
MTCLDVLLSHGADINHRDKRGRTPVFEVINTSNDNVHRKFLDKQPDLTITDYSGQTPLFELNPKLSRYALIAKLIVGAGVDVAQRNNKGQTFLHVAATTPFVVSDDFLAFVQLVFEQGFDVNARDNTGRTPLLEAAKALNEKLVALLIQHSADLNAADDHGWTPLSTAIASGGLPSTILLLENGADPAKPGPNGEGLVDMAVRLGRDELIEPLKTAMEKRLTIRHEERTQSAT